MASVRSGRPRSSAGWARRSPCSPPACWERWPSRCSRRSSRRSTAARRSSGGPGRATGIRSSTSEARWSAAALGLATGPGVVREDLPSRAWFGFGVGVAGVRGRRPSSRLPRVGPRAGAASSDLAYYLVHALLGGFIGAAIGFYLDATQVAVVVAKFHRYLAAGRPPEPFDVYPLLSKWGLLDLGYVTGGVRPAVRRVAGGRHQLVHPPPGCSRSTGRSWRPTSGRRRRRSGRCSPDDGMVQLDART